MTREYLKTEIEKLQQKTKKLVSQAGCTEFLEQMSRELEIPYSVHKYRQDQQEDIAGMNLPLDAERRSRYNHHINGYLIDALKDKLHNKEQNNRKLPEGELSENTWNEFLRTCSDIDRLQDVYSLVTNLDYQLEKEADGYKVAPGPNGHKGFLKLATDAERFRWFSPIGLNKLNARRQAYKQLYPEHLVPKPGEVIDQDTVYQLARSFAFKRHLLLNLTDLRMQLVHNFGKVTRREIPPISINNKKVSLSHTLSVITLLSFISRLQVAQLDAFASQMVKDVDEEVYKRFPSASNLAQVKAQSMAKPASAIFKVAAETLETDSQMAKAKTWHRQQVDQQLRKISWLCHFDKKQLVAWIAEALQLDKQEVTTALSLIDFKRTSSQDAKNANYLWQPLLVQKGSVSWLPNTMAYIVPSEILSNTLFSLNFYDKSKITEVSEQIIAQWFASKGFDVLPEEHKAYPSNDNATGDFDILAHKDGHYYHFELKQTAIRNDLKKKFSYQKDQLKKAKSQLKRARDFIFEFPEEINKKMGLPDDCEITDDNLHSYVLTNTTDFDKESYGEMLKLSLYELYLILFECEHHVGMDQGDFHQYQLLRIEQFLKRKPTENIKKVILGGNQKSKDDLELARRFFIHHGRLLREKLPYYSKHPLWAIEGNWYAPKPNIPVPEYQEQHIQNTSYFIPV